jgi:hypothetical protein
VEEMTPRLEFHISSRLRLFVTSAAPAEAPAAIGPNALTAMHANKLLVGHRVALPFVDDILKHISLVLYAITNGLADQTAGRCAVRERKFAHLSA